jgi:hypothetical protein
VGPTVDLGGQDLESVDPAGADDDLVAGGGQSPGAGRADTGTGAGADGDRAIVWLERRSSTFGNIIRTWESLFRKASYPLVFIAPNNFICLFAGSAGMRPAAFVTLNVSGTFFRLFLIRQVGEAFSSPIDSLLGFIQDYRWPLTALSVGVVLFTIMNDRRSGRGDLEALAHIEDDLEGPPEPPPTDQD